MIPFDADPTLYIPLIICIISVIIFIIPASSSNKENSNIGLFGILIFSVIGIGYFVGVIASGSVYTDTITICTHTEGYSMKVVDTNQNLYYVVDDITQMKVKDNIIVNVKVENRIGSKYIYSIDTPITCGNQTCGVLSV